MMMVMMTVQLLLLRACMIHVVRCMSSYFTRNLAKVKNVVRFEENEDVAAAAEKAPHQSIIIILTLTIHFAINIIIKLMRSSSSLFVKATGFLPLTAHA